MNEKLTGKVESVTLVKNIAEDLDLCQIQIDFDKIFIFYNHNELMSFVGNDVEYSIRRDMVMDKMETVICNIAKISNIQVAASSTITSIVPQAEERLTCNFKFKDLKFGEYYPACTGLLTSYEVGSSDKSRWLDCTVLDKESKAGTIRLFVMNNRTIDESEEIIKEYVGHYVQFNLEYTKYGYQVKEITCLTAEVELSPAVVLSENFIRSVAAEDNLIQEYCDKYDFINTIKGLIDGEPGYALVRIATMLMFINTLDNTSAEFDIQAMKRAAFMMYGYLLPHKTNFSKSVLNVNRIMYSKELLTDKELLIILDVLSEEEITPTKKAFFTISDAVNAIINIRRGSDEEVLSNLINSSAVIDRLFK